MIFYRLFVCRTLVPETLRFTRQCKRDFFTLPDLSSFSPLSEGGDNGTTQTYHERKIFPYKRKQLYDLVADIRSYPHFIPFCTNARIISTSSKPEDVNARSAMTMEAELSVGFLSFKESYVSNVKCIPYESVEAIASSSTPLFKTLTTAWRFQPASSTSPHSSLELAKRENIQQASTPPRSSSSDQGPTLVTFDLSYAFANPVHSALSAAFFGQISQLMVKAFERRCLEVYGRGTE